MADTYEQFHKRTGVQSMRTEDIPDVILKMISLPLSKEEFNAGGIQEIKHKNHDRNCK